MAKKKGNEIETKQQYLKFLERGFKKLEHVKIKRDVKVFCTHD